MFTFTQLVDEIRKLDEEQIQELESIIQHVRIEKARKGFLKSHKEAMKELKAGKLRFSSDLRVLKKELGL